MKMKMLEHFAKLAKTDIATAEKIIEDLGGIRNIGVLGIPGLARHPKLTQAKAEAIHHGIQLGRLSMLTYQGKESITSPEASYNALKEYLYGFPEERFAVLFLNRRRNLITKKLLTIGSEAYTIVDPRQIFHYAVGYRASALILGHNHPSGNPNHLNKIWISPID